MSCSARRTAPPTAAAARRGLSAPGRTRGRSAGAAAGLRRLQRERQVLDYDDLLVTPHALLADHPEVRVQLGCRYRYVMVDEYQDTNPLQAQIVHLLGAEHGNVMAVGDDAQSIYAFRGADFRNIMQFPALFPGARVITLEQNLAAAPSRSLSDVVCAVMAGARERYTKVLFTSQPVGAAPLLIAAENESFQSRFVCQRILEREEGVRWRRSPSPLQLPRLRPRAGAVASRRPVRQARRLQVHGPRQGRPRPPARPGEPARRGLLAPPPAAPGGRRAEDRRRPRLPAPRLRRRPVRPRIDRRTPVLHRAPRARRPLPPHRDGRPPSRRQLAEVRYYDPCSSAPIPTITRQRDLEYFVSIAARYRTLQDLLTDMALEPPSDSAGDVLAADADEGRLWLVHHPSIQQRWSGKHGARDRLVEVLPLGVQPHGDDEIEEERRLLYVATTRAQRNATPHHPINMSIAAVAWCSPSRRASSTASGASCSGRCGWWRKSSDALFVAGGLVVSITLDNARLHNAQPLRSLPPDRLAPLSRRHFSTVVVDRIGLAALEHPAEHGADEAEVRAGPHPPQRPRRRCRSRQPTKCALAAPTAAPTPALRAASPAFWAP
ncbi:MAG: ATP-dependent helicase [Candidatus Binatia bacterium]